MAVTHIHANTEGSHLDNDGKEFGEDVHSKESGEHTHSDVEEEFDSNTGQSVFHVVSKKKQAESAASESAATESPKV